MPTTPEVSVQHSAVHLVIPARTRFLRLARLAASGLGSDLGFGVDDIEDLRVAVDELCAVLVDAAHGDDEGAEPPELSLTYTEDGDGLLVEGSVPAGDVAEPPRLHPVAAELVAVVADEAALGAADGAVTFRLRKRPTDPATDPTD